MDAVKIVWLPAAADALDREFDFLAAKNPQAARTVFVRIVALVRRLADFPDFRASWPDRRHTRLVIPGLPYVVVFRLGGESVQILRVFHRGRVAARLLVTWQ